MLLLTRRSGRFLMRPSLWEFHRTCGPRKWEEPVSCPSLPPVRIVHRSTDQRRKVVERNLMPAPEVGRKIMVGLHSALPPCEAIVVLCI